MLAPEAFETGQPVCLRLKTGEYAPVGTFLSVHFGEQALALARIRDPVFGWVTGLPRPPLFARGPWKRTDELPAGYVAPHPPRNRDLDPFIAGAVAAKHLVLASWETADPRGRPGWHVTEPKLRRIGRFVEGLRRDWRMFVPVDYLRSTESGERYRMLVGLWRERARVAAEIWKDATDLAQKRGGQRGRTSFSETNLAASLARLRRRHAIATETFLRQTENFCANFSYAPKECVTLRMLAGYILQSRGERILARRQYVFVLEQWPTADYDATLTAMIRCFDRLAGEKVVEAPLQSSLPEAMLAGRRPGEVVISPTPRPTDYSRLPPTPPGYAEEEPLPFDQPVPSRYPYVPATSLPER